ncbi:MAG: mucoidy inhibitor MuiA family protein [candidate division WOR-3 bacterium]|nr:mucoidy inhibitor MuiA family protein [candidate division WOR-3 bacterium]MCX7756802.1 mucoidy inhibitor MuiA family protein [candidate division WOR-3 bacterium]MDW7988202.1 mucoidy inhibitor MuiA family protein [candidate division WOR-3 bacterium]
MKKFFLNFILLINIIFIPVVYGAITVNTKVDSVILYPDRAWIFRTGQVSFDGSITIKISGLSGMLDDNSVRIKSDKLKIGEVQIKRSYLELPSGRVKELKDSIKLYEEKEKALTNEEKVLETKEEFLKSIKLGAPEIISRELQSAKISPLSWTEALNFIAAELTKVKKRTLEVQNLKEEYKKKLDAWRKELADIQAILENQKEIYIELFTKTYDNYSIELSYLVPYASNWQAYYELQALPEANEIGVNYYAKIAQRTGEDWEATKIILTTLQAPPIGTLPEIYPWWLTLAEKEPQLQAAPLRAVEEVQTGLEAKAEAPKIQETGISLRYPLTGKISVKSGEPAKKFLIANFKIPATFEYFAFPKASELVFLSGKAQNSSEYILLPGEASTYVGSEFSGKTFLSRIAPQESLAINFGTDLRVKVKRELVRTLISEVGLFAKRIRHEFSYRTTLENYYQGTITVKLVEQIPLSQHKDLEIKVTKVEPSGYEENKELGTYTWYKNLAQKEKFIVNLDYYLEYPKGKIIQGL